jgi:hypothetical protein
VCYLVVSSRAPPALSSPVSPVPRHAVAHLAESLQPCRTESCRDKPSDVASRHAVSRHTFPCQPRRITPRLIAPRLNSPRQPHLALSSQPRQISSNHARSYSARSRPILMRLTSPDLPRPAYRISSRRAPPGPVASCLACTAPAASGRIASRHTASHRAVTGSRPAYRGPACRTVSSRSCPASIATPNTTSPSPTAIDPVRPRLPCPILPSRTDPAQSRLVS